MRQTIETDANGHPVLLYNSSGLLATSQLVSSEAGVIGACIVLTDGVNNATIIVYDNTSGSGKVLYKFIVSGADNIGGAVNLPVRFDTGVYVSITGTGAAALIYFIV